MTSIPVPDEYVLGRVLGKNIVDEETGEVIANCNDEITPDLLSQLRVAKIKTIFTIFTNELDHGSTSRPRFVWTTRRISSPHASRSTA